MYHVYLFVDLYSTPVFFNLFLGTEPFGAFRLLAEPHAVTQETPIDTRHV